MKKNILYRFLSALRFWKKQQSCSTANFYEVLKSEKNGNTLASVTWFLAFWFCLAITACGLEEPYGGLKKDESVIEFVARPTSYNKTDVATKSAASDIESAVYNAFLLVFDDAGRRIMCKEVTTPTTTPSVSIPIDRGLSSVTACFLINVPSSFANGIKGLTKPANVQTASDNEYINTAVLDGITYGSGSNFGIPYIDLDGPAEGSDPAVACIPMFGMAPVNLASGSTSAQITIKRLFAKITVDLTLDMDLDSWNNLIQTYTYLQLNYYELRNMPNRVRLSESTEQSAWVTDPNSNAFVTSEISSGTVNEQIYNKDSNTSNNKTCIFEFYVPEYYLNRASEWTDDEKSKPNNKPANAKAIHLFLDATYSQYSLTTTDLQYEIYLGRDAISDFSLARNVNYINTLTIKGIDQNDVDHRVTTTVINNPVAKEGKSANCYVIGKVGPYCFPAYKGAYNDLTKAVLCSNPNAKLVELVNDNEDNIVLDSLVYDVDKNIVSFKVSEIADGNVVIALVDDKNTDSIEDDEIEWSWHLWCNTTSAIDVLGWGDMKTEAYPTTAIMMDRNLGASSTSAAGLYYKYGDKNPFVDDYYGGGENGIQTWDPNLDSNTNDNVKSVYDPCPPGYKVPTHAAWGDVSGTEASSDALFSYCISPSSVTYYYHGLRNGADNNAPLNEMLSQQDTLSASGFVIEDSESSTTSSSPNHSNTNRVEYRIKTTTVREYINIKYKMPTKQKFGGFWTSDTDTLFKYYNYVADWSKLSLDNITTFMTMVECDHRVYVYSVEQKREKGLIFWGSWSDITAPITISDSITPGDADDLREINNGFTGMTSNKVLLWYHEREITTLGAQNTQVVVEEDSTNGYSVRCVSEASPVK